MTPSMSSVVYRKQTEKKSLIHILFGPINRMDHNLKQDFPRPHKFSNFITSHVPTIATNQVPSPITTAVCDNPISDCPLLMLPLLHCYLLLMIPKGLPPPPHLLSADGGEFLSLVNSFVAQLQHRAGSPDFVALPWKVCWSYHPPTQTDRTELLGDLSCDTVCAMRCDYYYDPTCFHQHRTNGEGAESAVVVHQSSIEK